MSRCHCVARRLAVGVITVALSACKIDLTGAMDGFQLVGVSLAEVNGSGVTGFGLSSVTTAVKDFEIAIQLSNTVVGQRYDGHVHRGTSCEDLADVVRSIPSAVGQSPEPGLPPSASTSKFRLPKAYVSTGYYVDFHATVNGVERRVACGAID